jgi:tRNA/rRNA methyltransferase
VVGTAGRDFAHLAAVEPRALAGEIVAAAARGPVGLVFGPEDHGLANADLGRCQRLIRIPSGDAYASLNLAQAIAVCAYELRLASLQVAAAAPGAARKRPRGAAARGGGSAGGPRAGAADQPASSAEREALVAHLSEALDAIGFLSRQNPQHILADVRGLFARAGLTRRDVQIWRGIARQMLWAARPR